MKKPKIRNPLIVFSCVAILLAVVFNALRHHLEHVEISHVNGLWIAPFAVLLLSIALVPFISRHWWEHYYPHVAFSLGLIVAVYYLAVLGNGPRLFLTFYEYVSFITLIGSLFVVAGGIHFRLAGKETPFENTRLLAIAAIASNLLGTTGASMLAIRPYMRLNRYRIRPYHIVFFIFIVSNMGGALTPIGDPPLFLGYLKGIPFFWIFGKALVPWAVAIAIILTVFFIIDTISFRRVKDELRRQAREHDVAEVSGLHNIGFLLMILVGVFIEKPLMLREVIMGTAAFASYFTTTKEIHHKNSFNFLPIKEVAILFAGIFATMIPALDWLELHAKALGLTTPGHYFWATGTLSSFLDNAPTYLNFLSATFGLHGASLENAEHVHLILGSGLPESGQMVLQPDAFPITAETWRYVLAVSLGAVFFGACTYIGNGPNFMVKSIAEQARIACPSFFGYVVKYSIPVLIPIFALIWLLFF